MPVSISDCHMPPTINRKSGSFLPKFHTLKFRDYAAGKLLVELAGGKVTDMYGQPLNFGDGRTLKTKGVVACERSIHSLVIEAILEVTLG